MRPILIQIEDHQGKGDRAGTSWRHVSAAAMQGSSKPR